MRVWDVNPGYLNRQSLLGEHREIHAILSITTHNKKGYARHPETLRWKNNLEALKRRHNLVVSEMHLRGYQHHSPVVIQGAPSWPSEFVDPPGRQFAILEDKYLTREPGRIALPQTTQQLWAQHKYSVLARDPEYGRQMEQALAQSQDGISLEQLAHELTGVLRVHPPERRLTNTLHLMWEHVSEVSGPNHPSMPNSLEDLIRAIRGLSVEHHVVHLLESTALNDLHAWVSASFADQQSTTYEWGGCQ
jgi:hypothetical protein